MVRPSNPLGALRNVERAFHSQWLTVYYFPALCSMLQVDGIFSENDEEEE
jgi:hypothetical protein